MRKTTFKIFIKKASSIGLAISLLLAPQTSSAGGWGELFSQGLRALKQATKIGSRESGESVVREAAQDGAVNAAEVARNSGVLPGVKAATHPEMYNHPNAGDDVFKEVTGGLFSSLRTETIPVTLTDSWRQVLSDMVGLLYSKKLGAVITGPKGSGKSQLVYFIEASFRSKAKQLHRERQALQAGGVASEQKAISHVLRLNKNESTFSNFEKFNEQLKNLAKSSEFQSSETIVFWMDDLKNYLPNLGADSGKNATEIDIVHYINAIQALQVENGPKIKILLEADESVYDQVTKQSSNLSNLVSGLGLVRVKPVVNETELLAIVKNAINRIQPDAFNNFTDTQVVKVIRWIKKYGSGDGVADQAIAVIDGTLSRQRGLVKMGIRELRGMTDEVIEGLEAEIARLEKILARAQQLGQNGRVHAKHLAKELPDKIKELKRQLAEEKEGYGKFDQVQEQLEELNERLFSSTDADEIAKISDQISTLEVEALQISDRSLALEVSRVTGSSLENILTMRTRMSLADFEKLLNNTIYGQKALKAIVMKIAKRVIEAFEKNDFVGKNTPIFSLILLGPPGTGKTTIGELLGRLMDDYFFVAGAEFKDKTSLNKLLGSEPGYVGYSPEGGKLNKALRKSLRQLLHFDEIEKAGHDFLQFVSGLLNPARVSSPTETQRTNQTVVAITMNKGQNADPTEFGKDTLEELNRQDWTTVLGRESMSPAGIREPGLPPELLSRADEIGYVGKSTESEMMQIFDKFLNLLNKDYAEMLMHVEVTPEVREALVRKVMETTQGTGRDIVRSVSDEVDGRIKAAFENTVKDIGENIKNDISDALSHGSVVDARNNSRALVIREGDLISVYMDEAGEIALRVADESLPGPGPAPLALPPPAQ